MFQWKLSLPIAILHHLYQKYSTKDLLRFKSLEQYATVDIYLVFHHIDQEPQQQVHGIFHGWSRAVAGLEGSHT